MNIDAPKPTPSVSFIVPALNEEEHIEGVVNTLLTAVQESRPSEFDIVLVNDGSTDKTGEVMERLAGADNRIKVVHNQRNLGLGGAWKSGVAAAQCDYVMMVVGDNIMPVSDISKVLSHLGEADIILYHLANRKLRSLGRRIGSRGFTTVINLLFGLRMKYYQGLVPRRELLKKITIKTDSYAFPAEVVVKLVKAGCSHVEVGITGTPCRESRSVALQPRRLFKVFQTIVSLVREMRRYERSLRHDAERGHE